MTVITVPKQKDLVSYLAQQKAYLTDLHTEVAELEELAKTGLDLSVDLRNNTRSNSTKRYISQDFSRATEVSLEKSVSIGAVNGPFAMLSAYLSFPVQTSTGETKVYCCDSNLDLTSVITASFQLKKDSFKYRVRHHTNIPFTLSVYSNRGTSPDLIEKARTLIETIYEKYPCQSIEGNEIEAQVLQEQPTFRELFFNKK